MRTAQWLTIAGLVLGSATVTFAASHNIADGFNFGASPTNPFAGWSYSDGTNAPLTTYTQDWNSHDFAPGQPGWQGPIGAEHAGWALLTDINALASGFEVVGGEVATHGPTSVSYMPSAANGDPITGTNNVSILGTIHNLRGLMRSGPWYLYRNNTDLLAAGVVNDSTLAANGGAPLNLAQNAYYYNANQLTVSGNQFTNVSYNPGDFFNVQLGTNDFNAVNLTFTTATGAGNGFAPRTLPPKVAYYRFEEASGVDIIDSISGQVQGQFVGVPAGMERTTDVPVAIIPKTGMANTKAADLRQGGSVLMKGSEFIFNESTAGGVDGGATLEWYMKVPHDGSPDIAGNSNGHTSIFWTNGIGPGSDSDRFNIIWDTSFTGAANSDRFIAGDYKTNAATTVMGPYSNGSPLTEDVWHHIAIVRKDLTPGNTTDYDFSWDWYIDGTVSPNLHTLSSIPTPSLDVFGWTIAGRPGFPFYALIDEVRMTAAALTPSQFLNSSAGVPGDFNSDGKVNGADFIVWQRGGSPNPGSVSDLALWKTHFGSSTPAAGAAPEPSTCFLAGLSLAAFVMRRRTRGDGQM
jgi:hypothetical protein